MPHVIVKLWPGKSEQQKKELAEAITKDVMNVHHVRIPGVRRVNNVRFAQSRGALELLRVQGYKNGTRVR